MQIRRNKPVVRTRSKSKPLEGFDRARIARECGCSVIETSTVDAYGQTWTVLEIDCHDNATAIKYLTAAAQYDAWAPEIREVAAALLRVHPGGNKDFASGVQDFVKRNVRYIVEEDEEFQSAKLTLAAGEGDCDKQARAVAAICIAGGILKAKCFGVANAAGEIVHVCAEIPDVSIAGGWAPLETTIDASYGEQPLDAARRLGILPR